MAAVPYAHIVANILRKKRLKGTNVSLAPNPKDIVSFLLIIYFCDPDTTYFLDMGEHAQIACGDIPEESNRFLTNGASLLLQHNSALRHLHPC